MTLPVPVTAAGRAGLLALLAAPSRALLAVDYDGTLAPIVDRPDEAYPEARALQTLGRLARCLGQIAIVTGRPADWVADTAGLASVPGLVIVGQYGAQRWAGGTLHEAEPAAGLAAIKAALPAIVAASQARIEDKGLSVVVHTRAAEHPDAELAALVAPVRELAKQHGMEAHPGRYVIEIRPAGFDKGAALAALVDEYDPSAVLFIGDDLGDLPAFAVVDSLRAPSRPGSRPGLTVCSGSTEVTQVATRADLVVDGPAGVMDLLSSLAESVSR